MIFPRRFYQGNKHGEMSISGFLGFLESAGGPRAWARGPTRTEVNMVVCPGGLTESERSFYWSQQLGSRVSL